MKSHLPRRRAESRSYGAKAKHNAFSSDTQFKGQIRFLYCFRVLSKKKN